MKKVLLTMLMCLPLTANAQNKAIKGHEGIASSGYPYSQVPFTQVKMAQNSFWGDRIRACRDVTIPLAFSKCQSEHRYENFVAAANSIRQAQDKPPYDIKHKMLFSFDDTDVYKTIEGASYMLQTFPDKKLKVYIDSVLDIVGAAQEPDGYLYTARTINPEHPHEWSGTKRWDKEEVLSHELYNLGHMVDAACAHYQALRQGSGQTLRHSSGQAKGSDKFLNIAKRYADCVCKEVGPNPGQATVVPGHQIAEMALVRLYILTGEKRYLDEAKYLLDYRGKTSIKQEYSQSDKPVVDQKEAVGHAVRAGYMYAGMADVAAITGDTSYIKAIDAIWNNIVSKKMYLTGGVGARHDGEAFGANYELPNMTAYNETCAAIAQVYLNHRMFLLHGDAKYIDVMERVLYNGVISGMSVDGGRFFYPNPLASDGKYAFNADHTTTRQPWFGCACCPSNLSRFIPSVPGYVYAVKDNNIYLNLYAANTATLTVNGKKVVLDEQTSYPWNGDITVTVKNTACKDFALKVRIPQWVRGNVLPSDLYSYADGKQLGYSVSVNNSQFTISNSDLQDGYFTITRQWKKGDKITIHFDMQPRLVTANKNVKDDEGLVAVERGPIVYCAEAADNGNINVAKSILSAKPTFEVNPQYDITNTQCEANPTSQFTVTALTTKVQNPVAQSDGTLKLNSATMTLIPYYAWNHRGANAMDVWFNSVMNY